MGDQNFTRDSRDGREEVLSTDDGLSLTIMVTSTSASPDLTAVGDMSGLAIGATVVSPSGPAGKTVIAMDNAAHTATLSGNAGVSATENWVFMNPSGTLIALQGKTIHLYASSFSPAVDNVAADFDAAEITFSGWTPPAGVWDAGVVDVSGRAVGESQTIIARPDSTLVSEVSIGGLYVKDGTGGAVWWQLDGPVILSDTTTVLKVMLTDTYPTAGQVIQILP